MNWSNVIVNNDELHVNLDGSYKTTKQKCVWVPEEDYINIIVYSYNKDRTQFSSPTIKEFIGEKGMNVVKEGDYLQLLKMGYYMCTKIDDVNIYLVEIN